MKHAPTRPLGHGPFVVRGRFLQRKARRRKQFSWRHVDVQL